jgi:helicase
MEMAALLKGDLEKEKRITADFEKILDRKQLTGLEQDLIHCLARNVAFHHSGLDQGLKEYIERLYLNREIDYLFATTGLAYGVNFPTKTVVLSDLTFYDPSEPGLRSDVPVYMYIQMAGRAGRPGFEKEGYSYIVTKNPIERQYKAPTYLKGEIERAVSHIGHDEYFRKALLELIYSGRNTDKQIQQFFGNTFHNYQSKKVLAPFLPFNLFDAIKNHMVYLYNNGLILPLGGSGYKLTDFGSVVASFLFWSFSGYELEPFIELKKFLEKEGEVRANFDVIYAISKLFSGVRLAKVPKKVSKKIEEFYENMGISDDEQAEYSAYAIFNGWMQNVDEFEIERDFHVYSSQLPQVAIEVFRILRMYESIAKKMNYKVSPEFKALAERVRYGVTEEELPFVKLKQVGRGTVRELNKYVRTVLKKTPWNYKGTLLEVLQQFYNDVGDKKFLDTHIKYIENVGQVRAERILNFIKQSQQK